MPSSTRESSDPVLAVGHGNCGAHAIMKRAVVRESPGGPEGIAVRLARMQGGRVNPHEFDRRHVVCDLPGVNPGDCGARHHGHRSGSEEVIADFDSLLLIRTLWLSAWVVAAGRLPQYLEQLASDIALLVLPARRPRSYPRAVKIKMTRYPRKVRASAPLPS